MSGADIFSFTDHNAGKIDEFGENCATQTKAGADSIEKNNKAKAAILLIERGTGECVRANFDVAIRDYNRAYDILAYEEDDSLRAVYSTVLWSRAETFALMGLTEKAEADKNAAAEIIMDCDLSVFTLYKKETFCCLCRYADQQLAEGNQKAFLACAEKAVSFIELMETPAKYLHKYKIYNLYKNLGAFYEKANLMVKAVPNFRMALNTAKGLKIFDESVAALALRMFENDYRRGKYECALKYSPFLENDMKGQLLRGCALYRNGNPEEAKACLDQAVRLWNEKEKTPLYYEALFCFAGSGGGDPEKLYKEIADARCAGTAQVADSCYILGDLFFNSRRYSESYDMYMKLEELIQKTGVRVEGCYPDILYIKLARACLAGNDGENAVLFADKALKHLSAKKMVRNGEYFDAMYLKWQALKDKASEEGAALMASIVELKHGQIGGKEDLLLYLSLVRTYQNVLLQTGEKSAKQIIESSYRGLDLHDGEAQKVLRQIRNNYAIGSIKRTIGIRLSI